ncbi:uncharacterized protein LOC118505065 [Anopheles stephensi]|uniref:uncharacterized protein LOC118505065 n=1 Tax=Anopheles stephensi TaxID=30069 RepID=UPI0016588010|nr:uncharacterized protein LOC118505065 [Anopheles stephensi]
MATSCLSCSLPVNNEELYKCAGSCDTSYHLRCIGVPEAALPEFTRPDAQALWICASCNASRLNGRAMFNELNTALDVLKDELLREFDGRLTAVLDAVRADVLSAVDRSNSNTHTLMPLAPLTSSTAAATPLSSRPGELDRASQNAPNRNAPKRRLVDFTPPDAVSAPPLNVGTAPISPSSRTVLTVPLNVSNGPKFWLYLTRIAPSVSDSDFKLMVASQLGTDDVITIRLVPRDKDPGTLSFISFKVGMSPDLKEKALSPSTWHNGIVFREFTDHRTSQTAQNFWHTGPREPLPTTSTRVNLPPNHLNPPLSDPHHATMPEPPLP